MTGAHHPVVAGEDGAEPRQLDAGTHPDLLVPLVFYSGLLLKAAGIPTDAFTVMFAIGRMPGWLAHWREQRLSGESTRIARPRQIYTGPPLSSYK